MSELRTNDSRRPWYREVWPWLLMLPPAASVVVGVMMLVLAIRTPSALVVDDYARIEELTSERFERDRRAFDLDIEATLRFSRLPSRVEVRLTQRDGVPHPRALRLTLRHATNPAADRVLELVDAGGAYAAAADPIPPGRYRVELMPPDGDWRLAGEIAGFDAPLRLRPQTDVGYAASATGPQPAGQ